MPQILQLQSGLAACNVLCSIQKWPELWKALFVAGETKVLKPTEFLTEINVEYSQSQVKREKEIDVFKLFCDVIQSLDHSQCLL